MKKDTYHSAQMVVERLIEDYGQDVLKIAYLYVKDQQLAEDIFQEVFYKVMKNYHKFEHLSTVVVRPLLYFELIQLTSLLQKS